MLGHNQYDWLKVVYNHKPDVGYQNIVHMGIQEGMSAIYVKLDGLYNLSTTTLCLNLWNISFVVYCVMLYICMHVWLCCHRSYVILRM